jgi:hypothetical protein
MDLIDTTNLSFDANSKKECMDELAKARWADGFVCPRCAGKKAYVIKSRNLLECANQACRKQTSAISGTQFHGSRRIEALYQSLRNSQEKYHSEPGICIVEITAPIAPESSSLRDASATWGCQSRSRRFKRKRGYF